MHKARAFAFEVLNATPRIEGIRVRGQCMTPTLDDTQKVNVQKARLYWPGDVVAALLPDGRAVAHRFLGYVRRKGVTYVVLKADDGRTEDPLVPLQNVLGRVEVPRISSTHRGRALARFLVASLQRALGRSRRPLPQDPGA